MRISELVIQLMRAQQEIGDVIVLLPQEGGTVDVGEIKQVDMRNGWWETSHPDLFVLVEPKI